MRSDTPSTSATSGCVSPSTRASSAASSSAGLARPHSATISERAAATSWGDARHDVTGTWLTSGVPEDYSALTFPGLTALILGVANTAGQRAIMIGIALGIAATSLRVILGVDRSYLGSGGD